MTTSREKAVCMIGNTGLRPDLIFPVEIGALLYTSARVLRQVLRARMLGWKRRQRVKEREWLPVGRH
jgi:hypothetical protein